MATDSSIWEEQRRWLRMKRELEKELEDLGREETSLMEELSRVEEQVAYYGSLVGDMKKAVDPPKLGRLLRSLRRL